ncbi:GAF domain-containing protein [Pedobacter aquatilis]|uniref:sensor histidine kinase n=1 Tax=Pedobacter aquatilis TaxID=351343 RepID=UPI002930361E|nr:GAF domain-containing protein [Pedobacter aquatilis]
MSKFSEPSKDNLTFEERRLKKLRRYDILQTPPELVFDLIAEIAKSTFASAGSFVSFIDVDTVFLKANTSEIVINTLNKDESLCTVAGRTHEITLIEDTNQRNEVKNSPFVQMDNGIKFYAAAPIISAEGFILGTVSVMDIKARFDIKEEQLDVLRWLANLTMEKPESRLVSRVAVKAYDDRLHRLAHDMKNPATTLIGFGQLMSRAAISAEKIKEMGEKIERIGRNISQTMNNLLSEAQNENATIDLKFETIKVSELIESVTRTFEFSLKNKNQTLEIHCYTEGYIQIDRE